MLLFLLTLMWIPTLPYLSEILSSWYFNYILPIFIIILALTLSFSITFVMMKFSRHEEMRIELKNIKYLKDIPNIKLNKVVKLKFSSQ
jgi:hypothetical protein